MIDFNNSLGFLSVWSPDVLGLSESVASRFVCRQLLFEKMKAARFLVCTPAKGKVMPGFCQYVFKTRGVSAHKGLIVCSPSPFTKTTGVSKSIGNHFVCGVCDLWTNVFF